jgi:FtsP/CotA-like multicopper oxidase with cupredoxin domain
MHSHWGLQEQRLMTAPLIVRDAAESREDRQEIVLMLHDFSFRPPHELLAGLTGATSAAARRMVMPMDGGMKMGLNDVTFDAYLANDRTLADPEVVRVAPGGRLRLRIINGASSSQFWIDLGTLTGQVVAVDGHPTHPVAGQRFPIAMAQRLDIVLELPGDGAFPILAQVEGQRARTGILARHRGRPYPPYRRGRWRRARGGQFAGGAA